MKKAYSIIVAIAISFSITIPASAANALVSRSNISVNSNAIEVGMRDPAQLTDTELKDIILDIGLSSAEADKLIALKYTTPNAVNTRAGRFPSNPSIGDIFTDEVYVSIDAAKDAGEAYLALCYEGVPANLAVIGAAAIYAFTNDYDNPGAAGIVLTIEYYYGVDNDGFVRWNYRRVWCDFYY